MLRRSKIISIAKKNKEMNRNQTEYITEREAAAYLNVSMSYLQHKRCEGFLKTKRQGPPYYKIGKSIRYKKNELEEWMQTNKKNQKN